MAKFYALQVIMGKVKFSKIPAKYQQEALAIINERGFYIDDDGECKPKPAEVTND